MTKASLRCATRHVVPMMAALAFCAVTAAPPRRLGVGGLEGA
jgi:hypothetical protein